MIRKLKNLFERLRHGTLFEAFQYRLGLMGIKFMPYYFVQEGLNYIDQSRIKVDLKDHVCEFLGQEDIRKIAADGAWGREHTRDKLLARLANGLICYGVRHHGEIVAFMWIDLREWCLGKHRIELNANEAYLFDILTLESFRGRGIAPYLRYQSYRILKDMGRERLFSYSDYFNRPSIRFKKKLNARFLKTGLYVELFGRYHRHWIIKDRRPPADRQ